MPRQNTLTKKSKIDPAPAGFSLGVRMFIKIAPDKMRSLDVGFLIQEACDQLSKRGVTNFYHRRTSELVELCQSKTLLRPVVDYVNGGVWLKHC